MGVHCLPRVISSTQSSYGVWLHMKVLAAYDTWMEMCLTRLFSSLPFAFRWSPRLIEAVKSFPSGGFEQSCTKKKNKGDMSLILVTWLVFIVRVFCFFFLLIVSRWFFLGLHPARWSHAAAPFHFSISQTACQQPHALCDSQLCSLEEAGRCERVARAAISSLMNGCAGVSAGAAGAQASQRDGKPVQRPNQRAC